MSINQLISFEWPIIGYGYVVQVTALVCSICDMQVHSDVLHESCMNSSRCFCTHGYHGANVEF